MAGARREVIQRDNRDGRHKRSNEQNDEIARRGWDGALGERRGGNTARGDEERLRELGPGRHQQNDGESKQRGPHDGPDDLTLDGEESRAVEASGVEQVAGRTADGEREENDGGCGRDPVTEPERVEQLWGVEDEEADRLRDEPDLTAQEDEENDGAIATGAPLRAGDRAGEEEAEDQKENEIDRSKKT